MSASLKSIAIFSSVSGLRSPVYGLWSPVSGLRSPVSGRLVSASSVVETTLPAKLIGGRDDPRGGGGARAADPYLRPGPGVDVEQPGWRPVRSAVRGDQHVVLA